MAGAFTRSKYEANNGDIYGIRVQPETLALALGSATNTAPTGAVDQKVLARGSGSRRAYGVHARKVTIQLTAALTGYEDDAIISLPWLNPTTFDALPAFATGTYLGTACILIGTTAEKIK